MKIKRKREKGFSLIEVSLALGIAIFGVIALLGLFVVGLETNKDSASQLQAAHIASLILNQRQATPLDQIDSPLPLLNQSHPSGASLSDDSLSFVSTTLTEFGTETSSPSKERYLLSYRIVAPPANSFEPAVIHMILSWPATLPLSQAEGRYEIVSSVRLP